MAEKSYIIVKNGLSRTPAPTIWLFFVNAFVGDGVLDVPKLVFRQPEMKDLFEKGPSLFWAEKSDLIGDYQVDENVRPLF